MVRKNIQRGSQSRLFTIEDRAGPSHAPVYQALGRVLGVTYPFGDQSPIRVPDPTRYGSFITVDKILGQPALPSTSIEVRMSRDISSLFKLGKKGCPFDLQIHIGACKDPSDFNAGWEKIGIMEDANFTSYGTTELGAFDADQENSIMETFDVTGTDYYEVKPLAFASQAESQIVQSVIDVAICDSRICGACGIPSDGTQRVFAVQTAIGASPGLPSELVYTQNGGASWAEQNITSLPANRAPIGITCVGPYLVAISNDDCSYHYALITDILAGTSAWTRGATGLTCATGSPRAIVSLSRTQTWIVGDGGYIYLSTDPNTGFTAQTSGDVTSQSLRAIDAYDEFNLLAGGVSNALLSTRNGGTTWSLVTGPVGQAAVTVNAVSMLSENEWFVGYNDGKLFYTIDGGVSWTQLTIPGSFTVIDAIEFSRRSVGYIVGHTATVAKILRTISGGQSWYALPETTGTSVPTAIQFNGLSVSPDDPNVVWFGGIKTANGDGVLVKGA